MPDKTVGKISRIFGLSIFVLLSAQIIAGCVWGILNFTSFREFPEFAEMLRLSYNMSLTGDTSVIYPALLLVTLALNTVIPFYEIIYVLQLVLAFAAWYTFASRLLSFKSRRMKIWFALAVVTNPFAMQCHLAVLEFSFVSSFLCLLVTFVIRFSLEWEKLGSRFGMKKAFEHMCVSSLFWMLASLTRKEFFFIGFFCMLILLDRICVNLRTEKKLLKVSPAIVFIAFFTFIHLADGAFRASAPLTVSDVLKRSLYMRVAWTEDLDERNYWPADIVTVVDEDTMVSVMHDPGIVRTDFVEAAEKNLGRKEISDLFLRSAISAFKDNKKGVIRDTAVDMAGYLFPSLCIEGTLSGKFLPGFSTGNYDVMKRNTPMLTKYYLRVSCVLYLFMAVISVVSLVLRKGFLKYVKLFAPALVIMVLTSVVYTFYGTNVWDHKKVLFTSCIWVAMFASIALRSIAGKEEA